MFTAESKSILAKLMATENITVQHRKVSTASFDPKNRILTCPIWKDMDGDLYDLLMGHEVGHALYTPAAGWHDVASKNGRSYKHFLNVVEDARIEKKVKRKYPGLSGPFHRAYNQLNKQDFFGLEGRTRKLAFIDRINLYFKLGAFINVSFNNETENELLEEVRNAESWDDVLKVTQKIWDYSKEEQQELLKELTDFFIQDSDESDDEDSDNYYEVEVEFGDDDFSDNSMDDIENPDGESSSDEDSDDEDESEEPSSETKKESETVSSDEPKDEESKKESTEINRFKNSNVSEQNQFVPRSETDENFRRNESRLIDGSSKEYRYVHVPTQINLDEIVTPAKRVIGLLQEFYSDKDYSADAQLQDFKRKNERYISMLAKEFEMRKAATKFSKAKVSSTGDIDINKIYKYKLDDAIFKKIMRVPKGKSHGLVLLLDKSGSMSNSMGPSIEQILVLAYFCRKVNIPFVVYGFGNALDAYAMDHSEKYEQFTSAYSVIQYLTEKQSVSKSGEMCMKPFFLREYLNSSMSAAEFQRSVKMMLLLRNTFDLRSGGRAYIIPMPPSESLSNTPLIESLFATAEIIKQFRTKHNLDIVNLAVVHDGDADALRTVYEEDSSGKLIPTSASPDYYNTILIDRKNKFQMEYKNCYDDLRAAVMTWITKTTGAKVYGFFLTGDYVRQVKQAIRHRYIDEKIGNIEKIQDHWERGRQEQTWIDERYKEFKKEKYLSCVTKGYDNFFLLPGGNDLKIDDDKLDDFITKGKQTNSKLASAFIKMNKSRQINRILVSQFIGGIAV